MIYYFKIISRETKNFSIGLVIDGDCSFYTFHDTIQKECRYDSHQMASFFLPDQKGNKQIEISLLDSGFNGFPYFSMHRTKISEMIHSQNVRLLYTFDFINDRSFIIELTGISMEKNLHEPLITLVEGEAPVQILDEEVQEDISTALQEDEVFQDFGVLEDYTEIFGEMEPI
jgi:hypothetical protein